MQTFIPTTHNTFVSAASFQSSVDELLAPAFEVGSSSSSLLASRHEVRIGTRYYDIPKFLLLGQRGGGKPIRVGLFAGLDANSVETSAALIRLLLQHELSPALARDYALFAYPIVNLRGSEDPAFSLKDFEIHAAANPTAPDVEFFRAELEGWNFDGLIALHINPHAKGFHASTRSEVLGREVALPALQTITSKLPVENDPVALLPADRQSRQADHARGKLTPAVGNRPSPFEFELFAPGRISAEQRITGLFLIVQEVLRNYRRLISHAQNI